MDRTISASFSAHRQVAALGDVLAAHALGGEHRDLAFATRERDGRFPDEPGGDGALAAGREGVRTVLRGRCRPPVARPAEGRSRAGRGFGGEQRRPQGREVAGGAGQPPGVGKSRLAVEVARSVTGRYPGGTWFVELSTLTAAELVPQAVADALGVRAEPGVRLADTVTAALARRKALLILDNCEHLLPACRSLAETLVTASAELRVLAASRQSLGISGEAIFPLPPLPVPGPDDPWEQAAASAVVWLFGARAASARPGFRVTEANIGLVRDICHRLDGIPLAIELAASRIAALPLRDIADRLDHQFRLLDARATASPGRHGGLDTAIQWSYDLISEPEQLLFERLSVFAGGFTLDDAEAVAGDARLPACDVAAPPRPDRGGGAAVLPGRLDALA